MELSDKTSDELPDGPYSESKIAESKIVEFIDSICLNNSTMSDGSTAATLTTSDGATLPITLVVSESVMSNNGDSNPSSIKESNVSEEPVNIIDGETGTHFVIEKVESLPQTLYTIQFSENDLPTTLEVQSADVNDEEENTKTPLKEIADTATSDELNNADTDSIQHQSDLHVLETTTRLEDFMDIVTTYKCKFCRFSCPWKSGLMSHIRNCHFEANKKAAAIETEVHNYALVPKDNEEQKKRKVVDLQDHGYSQQSTELLCKKKDGMSPCSEPTSDTEMPSNQPPPQERHIFLCGQCSEGFNTLDGCKDHMVKDHDLNLEPSPTKEKTPKKRGRPRIRRYPLNVYGNSSSVDDSKNPLDEAENNIQENIQKRQSRTPKNLEDDYYLEGKRRRIRRECISDKPYRCNERGCGYRFSNMSHLQYHSTCHTFCDKPFACPECGECADHWRGLSMHLWKEHTVDVDLHTCIDCGYKTYSHFKLDNHKKIHSEERSFVCPTCGKGFKQLSQMRNHLVIHIDRKNMMEKRWYSEQKCEICNRTFSDSKCLRKHQQAVHSKLKPYVCTYCGHMSARKAMLQLHMRQHTGEKPFLCEHCEYRTGDHNSLRRHRMRHTGTKPYKCPHCPYACIQAISYKTHLKNKHPGLEGLYACSLCAFRSVSKENFLNHMSDHRRGALPGMSETDGIVESISEDTISQGSAQMHLPENTLQQLEGMLPGNITAAQLIYSCLNALSQEGGTVNLPPGVTTTSTCDGTQTITIQLPAAQEVDNEQFYFTIQQQDGSTAALVLPGNEENSDEPNVEMEILQPITIMHEDASDSHSIDSSVFVDTDNEHVNSVDSNSLVIAHSEHQDVPVSEEDNA